MQVCFIVLTGSFVSFISFIQTLAPALKDGPVDLLKFDPCLPTASIICFMQSSCYEALSSSVDFWSTVSALHSSCKLKINKVYP